MSGKALGLIEVNGLVGAIEAADSALKAADVKLIGVEKISSGLTTVKIIGDVAAVQEAIAVAKIAVSKISSIFSSTVISKMDNQTEAMILNFKDKTKKSTPKINSDSSDYLEGSEKVINEDISKINTLEVPKEIEGSKELEDELLIELVDESKDREETKEEKVYTIIEIKSMKVEELRRLARLLKITEMNNKQIKFAKKDRLIDIIDKHYRKGDK